MIAGNQIVNTAPSLQTWASAKFSVCTELVFPFLNVMLLENKQLAKELH